MWNPRAFDGARLALLDVSPDIVARQAAPLTAVLPVRYTYTFRLQIGEYHIFDIAALLLLLWSAYNNGVG